MLILKIGGGSTINLEAIASDLATLHEPIIIVLGANAERDALAKKLNQPVKTLTSVSGVSSVYTDEKAIDLQMMAYAGIRANRFVELLQQNGVNAISLSGIDGGLIRARRNRGFRVMENGKKMMVRDHSGKPDKLNFSLLNMLVQAGYTPVITVPIIDEQGVAVNTENDDVVALIQQSFDAPCVMHLIEAPGLLRDPQDANSLVPTLSPEGLDRWVEDTKGRMKRKIMSLRNLFGSRPTQVHISDGRTDRPITAAINGAGTVIQCSI